MRRPGSSEGNRAAGATLIELGCCLLIAGGALRGLLIGVRIGTRYGVLGSIAGPVLGLAAGIAAPLAVMFALVSLASLIAGLFRLPQPGTLACAERALRAFEEEFHEERRPREAWEAAVAALEQPGAESRSRIRKRSDSYADWGAGCPVLRRTAWQRALLAEMVLRWETWVEDRAAWEASVEQVWIPRVERGLAGGRIDVSSYVERIRRELVPWRVPGRERPPSPAYQRRCRSADAPQGRAKDTIRSAADRRRLAPWY